MSALIWRKAVKSLDEEQTLAGKTKRLKERVDTRQTWQVETRTGTSEGRRIDSRRLQLRDEKKKAVLSQKFQQFFILNEEPTECKEKNEGSDKRQDRQMGRSSQKRTFSPRLSPSLACLGFISPPFHSLHPSVHPSSAGPNRSRMTGYQRYFQPLRLS